MYTITIQEFAEAIHKVGRGDLLNTLDLLEKEPKVAEAITNAVFNVGGDIDLNHVILSSLSLGIVLGQIITQQRAGI